jgi:hypothetical protein
MKNSALKILKSSKAITWERVSGTSELIMACPSCSKDDHFYFNEEKDVGVCHRCKWQCNGLILIMAVLGIDIEAAHKLLEDIVDRSVTGLRGRVRDLLVEDMAGPEELYTAETFFKNPLPKKLFPITKKSFPAVFVERGISYNLAKSTDARVCQSGFYARRLIFPIKTLKSETFTAVTSMSKKRYKQLKAAAKKRGEKFRKSLFPKQSFLSEMIYGYGEAFNNPKPLVYVEGVWDYLALKKLGINVIGILGNFLSYRQALLISRMKSESVYSMLDGSVDKILLQRNSKVLNEMCLDKTVRTCVLPNGKDPDEATKKEIKNTLLEARQHVF